MNGYQAIWWEQARSDHSILILMRERRLPPCHQLHYLQMVTEKLGKAYFWRKAEPPKKTHALFVKFLQALSDRSGPDRTRIARIFGFARPDDFERWIKAVAPLAYDLERLAPALADDGPNPEYPWPRKQPVRAPASFPFPIWDQLNGSGKGHQLLRVIDAAVLSFPEYA